MPEKLKEWSIASSFSLWDKDKIFPDGVMDDFDVFEDGNNSDNSLGGCTTDIRTACLMAEIPHMHNLLIELSGADVGELRQLQLRAREILKRIYTCERLQDYIMFPMDYLDKDYRSDKTETWRGDRSKAASWN